MAQRLARGPRGRTGRRRALFVSILLVVGLVAGGGWDLRPVQADGPQTLTRPAGLPSPTLTPRPLAPSRPPAPPPVPPATARAVAPSPVAVPTASPKTPPAAAPTVAPASPTPRPTVTPLPLARPSPSLLPTPSPSPAPAKPLPVGPTPPPTSRPSPLASPQPTTMPAGSPTATLPPQPSQTPTPTAHPAGTPAPEPAPTATPRPLPAATPSPTPAPTPAPTPPSIPGPLAVTRTETLRFAAVLNGRDTIVTAAMPLAVTDGRGSGAGWHLVVAAGAFANARGQRLAAEALVLTDVAVSCRPGACDHGQPAITEARPVVAGGNGVTVFRAPPGMELRDLVITPTFALRLPANAYAGIYAGTVVVTVVSE